MSAIIRIGIVGAGAIVEQRHIPGLRCLPGVEITAVCNSSAESSQRAARSHGIAIVHDDWRSLVADPSLDAVIIGTPPFMHAEVSIAALDAGKHVFCQARMATDLPSALSMQEAAVRHPDLVAMLCPAPNALRHGAHFSKLLASGVIGRVIHFRLIVLGDQWSDSSAPAHWRQRVEISGQNILSLGIYAETLRRLIGQPSALVAQARVVHPLRQDYQVRVPDIINILGDWPDGVVGALEFSGVSRSGPREELVVYGERGTLSYNFKTDEICVAGKDAAEMTPVQVPHDDTAEWQVERDFVFGIRNKLRPEPSFATGVAYMRVIDAVHRSLELRSWVNL